MKDPDIREGGPEDLAGIEQLYREAFPEEDLWPLVGELLDDRSDVLSLVAIRGAASAGHAIFTRCGLEGQTGRVALLGPVAVASICQRQGIGSALIRAGLGRLKREGVPLVCVLGDPEYYGRFGFAPEARVTPPYALPAQWREAWQSLRLGNAEPPGPGKLAVPGPWQFKELWLP